jgi:rod shape-determining protein MreD
MIVARILLNTAVTATAVLVQLTVVNPLNLPGGGPDLALLALLGLALVQGAVSGAVTGFFVGLMLDVVPPADGEIGQWALVLCLVGYVTGLLGPDVRGSAVRVVALVAGLSALEVLGYAAIGLMFGAPGVSGPAVLGATLGTVGYDVLLAPFVVPAVMALARRVEPDPLRV